MSIKELQELMKLMNRHNLVEFNMKDGDFEIAMRSEQQRPEAVPMIPAPAYVAAAAPAPAAAPASPAAAPASAPTAASPGAGAGAGEGAKDDSRLVPIKSPMPGTFYRAASPDKPPFTKVGDDIAPGQVVCMIEAMKLFNELESEVGGRIVRVLVEDAQPVEYDQVLFMVEPS